jgi:hypothetical protein
MNAWDVTVGEQTVVMGGDAEQAKRAAVDFLAGNKDVLAHILTVTETSVVNADGATVRTIGVAAAPVEPEPEVKDEPMDEPEDCPDYDDVNYCVECGREWETGENFCPVCGTER